MNGVWIQCKIFKNSFHFQISKTVSKYIIPVFIRAILFHRVGILWMIQTKEKIDFSDDENLSCWCKYGPWYNAIICNNLHGPLFGYLFITSHQ